jgi:uncharacterized protein YecT (DUF1311 family)
MTGNKARIRKLFHEFCLEDRVPADHMLRKIELYLGLGAFVIAAAVLGASPSLALDCKQATSEGEKAICATPAAFAADAAMNKAYGALRAMLDPAQRAALAKAQAAWLSQRYGACFDKHGADLGVCLADETGKRSRFLNAAPEAGPGYSGKLVPFFRMEKGGKGKTDVDVQAFRFAAPASGAERAFNAAVDKSLGGIRQPLAGNHSDTYAFGLTMTLAYASPHLLSARAEVYADLGGAHPSSGSFDINIDPHGGRELVFDLVDNAGAQKIFALCFDQVLARKKEHEGDDAKLLDAEAMKDLHSDVAAATEKLTAWGFGGKSATVSYDPYTIGARWEGPFSCEVPYAFLRPLAKPRFPLPP